jgi:sugar lactone lactonase YvrE
MALTLRNLVSEQEPEVLGADFQFTEGPVWHPEGYLLFSDIPANTIYRYTPRRKSEPYITPSHNSNGLTFDASGRLLACENGRRQVSRMDDSGQMITLVSHSNGKRLNSPNDIVVHSRGSVFFTYPPYGIDPDPGEQGFNGVYHYDPDDGSITVLRTDMDRPNGLAFSPDESILYVDDTRKRHMLPFPVNSDLTLGVPHLLLNMDVPEPGNPDGMKVDREGNIYVTGGGLWVLDPAGRHLGIVPFPQATANLAFGGSDY